MSSLVTADWHLTELTKDRYRFKAIRWLIEYIKENEIGRMIMLGDLTHNKNYHPDTLVNEVADLLHEIAAICELVILQGNHDYIEATTPFFHFVRRLPGVTWLRRPTLMALKGIGQCGFLPHTRDYEGDWGDIKKDWAGVALIFAHNSFEGAVSETGKRLSGIPLSVFPNVEVISGDIHSPQRIGKQLTYVGAPYTQKFGDDFEPRVMVIANGGVTSVKVPGPQKRLVDISNPNELRKHSFADDDMIKVRYHLPPKDREIWPEIRASIQRKWPRAQIRAILEQETLKRTPEHRTTADDQQLVRAYGAQQQLSPDMMVTGYELLNEA